MDERAQRRWRDRLAMAMARRLRAWAEAVLPEPSGTGNAPRAAVPRQEEAPPSGTPAGWLKDVQGLQAGPPADWVEFVRRNARNAPVRMANRISAPRPAPAEPPAPQPALAAAGEVRTAEVVPTVVPQPPRRESTEGTPFIPGTPVSPKGWLSQPQAGSRAGQRAGTPRPPAFETPGVSTPRVILSPVFQELPVERPRARPVPRFEPREASPTVPSRNEVLGQLLRPGPQAQPPDSRADAHSPAVPERTTADGPAVARTLAPIASRPRHSEVRSEEAAKPREQPPAALPFWSEEPAVERRADSGQEPQEDLAALIERSWPDLAEKEEQQQAQPPTTPPERPEPRWSAPWPDLPEALSADPAEAGALLRQWERLSRLDREQRGE